MPVNIRNVLNYLMPFRLFDDAGLRLVKTNYILFIVPGLNQFVHSIWNLEKKILQVNGLVLCLICAGKHVTFYTFLQQITGGEVMRDVTRVYILFQVCF